MPTNRPADASGASGGGGGPGSPDGGGAVQRTSFRPPWVKESPPAIPMPTAPWTLANRNKEMQNQQKEESEQKGPARKTSSVKIVPIQPAENGVKDPHTFQVPKLKETPKTETKLQSREIKVPITLTSKQKQPPITTHIDKKKEEPVKEPPKREEPKPTSFIKKTEEKQIPVIIDKKKQEPVKEPPKKEEPKTTPTVKKAEEKQIPINIDKKRQEPVKEPPKKEESKIVPVPTKKEEKQIPIQQEVKEIPIQKEVKKEVKEAPKNVRRGSKDPAVANNNKEPDIEKVMPATRNAMVRQESLKKFTVQQGPTPPPMPPMPPPPPPGPPMNPSTNLTAKQLEKIEQLKARPKHRPDWTAMLKEVESGKKLRKVECNDRSQPLLPRNKAKGQFIYESEKTNLHNQFLRQIQTGTSLRHVKCNDRSKPILEGLRKFRRQLTIEEQIQKSQSIANMPEAEVEEEVDEMDDIDKVRDDLQSTKQMLALELRNKETQIRENKRLQAKILNLEAALEEARTKKSPDNNVNTSNATADDKVVQSLKEEAKHAKKQAEEIEQKFHETTDQLATAKFELEEAKRQNVYLEKKLAVMQTQDGPPKRVSVPDNRAAPPKDKDESESEEDEESEPEEEEVEGETEEAKAIKRLEREIRLLGNKLRSYKNKEEAARRERKSLRDQMKKLQQSIKQEKKKYKNLQKEVNKMAALMRDDEDAEDGDEEKDEEECEEEVEEESESESESESSEEEESSDDEGTDLPLEKKKDNLHSKAKRHENCLNALKKGNYMLKANVDRLKDDLNKQKEDVITLQEDLDSVLADLG